MAPGYETQREKWEKQYAEANTRWEAHKAQVHSAAKADADSASGAGTATSYSSATGDTPSSDDDASGRATAAPPAPAVAEGTLASDEALAALREKLTGN